MSVVLVTNELWPFVTGGGIGRYVAEAASVLAEHDVDVTILTSDRFKDEHAALAARQDPSVGPPSIRWAWAEEPTGDLSPFWSWQHAWSYSCHRALAELGLERSLVEFEDYGGAAMVTLDAARAGHPALAHATLAVRTHTAWEMTQALDERPLDSIGQRAVMAMERHGLRFADLLLSPAQLTLDAYRRFYGTRSLAPAAIAPIALRLPEPSAGDDVAPDGRLKLLYFGRLQRLKGVHNLVEAMTGLDRDDVALTIVGKDTETGPGGRSMRAHLERLIGDDERIELRAAVARAELSALIRAHHAVVVPSLFESFGYVAREAQAENRPVIVTPVGGLATTVDGGRGGWVTADASPAALREVIAGLAERPEDVAKQIEARTPRAVVEAEADPEHFLAPYRDALAAPAPRAGTAAADGAERPVPLTALVTLNHGDKQLEATLDGLEAQQWPGLEVVVALEAGVTVPIGLLPRIHGLVDLDDDATAVGEGRRAAYVRAAGRGPLLLLAAGHRLAPGFLENAVAALRANPELPYVTAYAEGRAPGAAPVGNHVARLVPELKSHATVALFRPDALADGALAGWEDGELYLELAAHQRFGAVLPEWLVAKWFPSRSEVEGDTALALALALGREEL